MSGFSDAALEKKLAELNNSQQSIQTLSLWLIHHRKHHASIVKIWLKEFTKGSKKIPKSTFPIKFQHFYFLAKDSRKLTFIYLVNDVIQNSRKKGPEFRDHFGPILAPALKLMGQAVNDENTQKRLERILNIWGDRNMFDSKQIAEFRKSLGISYRNNFHYVILNDTFMQNHVSREDLTMENPLSKYQEEIGVRAAKC
jgi:regulator of Ty1 transposition protein 103